LGGGHIPKFGTDCRRASKNQESVAACRKGSDIDADRNGVVEMRILRANLKSPHLEAAVRVPTVDDVAGNRTDLAALLGKRQRDYFFLTHILGWMRRLPGGQCYRKRPDKMTGYNFVKTDRSSVRTRQPPTIRTDRNSSEHSRFDRSRNEAACCIKDVNIASASGGNPFAVWRELDSVQWARWVSELQCWSLGLCPR
jgi:hypothetical protein